MGEVVDGAQKSRELGPSSWPCLGETVISQRKQPHRQGRWSRVSGNLLLQCLGTG